MKQKFEYHFSTNHSGSTDDNESFIEDYETKYTSLGKTPCGNTAYSRFFGTPECAKFVVKQPKPNKKYYTLTDLKNPELNALYKDQYEHELEIWNLVYPENKARLVTNGGLRLILPKLPGERLSRVLFDLPHRAVTREDQLTFGQITLAVFCEFKRFYELGLSHNDFNQDNILIDEKQNGTFRAYLIDLDAVIKRDVFVSNMEWLTLESLIQSTGGLEKYYDTCHLGYIFLRSIDANIKNESEACVKLDEIKNELSLNKPTLIRVKNLIQTEDNYYFVYGCLNNGKWGFTKLDTNIISSADIANFSGELAGPSSKEICLHINAQKGHVSYSLDLYINCLNLKIAELNLELNKSKCSNTT